MIWSKLSAEMKAVGGLLGSFLVVLAGAFGWMTVNFETVAASEQKWQAHIQSNQCAKVSDYRIKVERLKWDLDNLELSERERAARERDLKLYLREIEKLDPNGAC